MEFDIRGCENLANAIVKKAFEDYKSCLDYLSNFSLTGDKTTDEAQYNLLISYLGRRRNCINFFKSNRYGKLTSLDYTYVLEKIDAEYFDNWDDYIDLKIKEVSLCDNSDIKNECMQYLSYCKNK